jgi:hypothetical protein
MANTWLNNDGLFIKYGVTEAGPATTGEYNFQGSHYLETVITLSTLAATPTILDDTVKVPRGSVVYRIETYAEVAATGSGALLNVGLIREDRTTENDYNGYIAVLPLTSIDATGETTTLTPGATYAGALAGVPLTYDGFLTADYDTAAYATGKLRVKIFYYIP